MRTSLLTVVATAFVALAAMHAQGVPKLPVAEPTTPAPIDRATVLRQVAIAHGMLRGLQYADATTTAQFQATGVQYIFGQAFKPGGPWPVAKLTKYSVWINYAVPGIRIDLERTNSDGPVQGGGGLPFAAPQRQILVVGGTRAWNEINMPGGPATPAIGQEKERALQIWMLPQGVVKAATMAGDKLVVGREGNKLTLTFPLPEPAANYIEKARFDERKLVEHVEVSVDEPVVGRTAIEADYDNYKDPDLSDIPFPFHIVQKLGGFPILDLNIQNARMYNPYVVIPTPDNVERAYAANTTNPQSIVELQKLGDGTWLLGGATHNSVAVEFKDHVVLIECPVSDDRAAAVFETLKQRFPKKRVQYVVNTHHHFDHAGGLRHALIEGSTILTARDNKPYFEKALASVQAKLRIEPVVDKRTITDGMQTLELYKIQGSNHADTMLIAYLPKEKLLVEADMWNPPAQPDAPAPRGPAAFEPLNLWANLERLRLDVEQIAPLHGRVVPFADFRRAVEQMKAAN